MTKVDETMPEWVLIEAVKRCGFSSEAPTAYWDGYRLSDRTFRVLCDMILKHEQPPVDPKLATAREACAQVYEGNGLPTAAAAYRAGNYDDGNAVQAALLAIDLWEKKQ